MVSENQSSRSKITFVRVLLWPAQSFVSTREFISRIPAAGLSITIIGEILSSLGLSPGIASAVSILGLASVFTEVGLKVILMSRDPLKKLGLKNRATAFIIYFLSGLSYFVLLGPGSIEAPVLSITQFLLGLLITYIAGTVFMLTWMGLERDDVNISFLILGSMSITIGFLALGFWTIDTLIGLSDNDALRQALFNKPSNITENASVVSTDPAYR